jgi:hypothetical protein
LQYVTDIPRIPGDREARRLYNSPTGHAWSLLRERDPDATHCGPRPGGSGMPREYEKRWPDCKAKYLVLSTDRFIVFLDEELDVDWATSEQCDTDGQTDRVEHNSIINEAALLEATPCEGIPVSIKTQFNTNSSP